MLIGAMLLLLSRNRINRIKERGGNKLQDMGFAELFTMSIKIIHWEFSKNEDP